MLWNTAKRNTWSPVTINTKAVIAIEISERKPKLIETHWRRMLSPAMTPMKIRTRPAARRYSRFV